MMGHSQVPVQHIKTGSPQTLKQVHDHLVDCPETNVMTMRNYLRHLIHSFSKW